MDRSGFASPETPLFEDAVNDARLILLREKNKLDNLVYRVRMKIENVDFDLGRLTEVGMEGSDGQYLVLLNERELAKCIALHYE